MAGSGIGTVHFRAIYLSLVIYHSCPSQCIDPYSFTYRPGNGQWSQYRP